MKLSKRLTNYLALATIGGASIFNFSACKKSPEQTDVGQAAEQAAKAVASEPAVEIDSSGYNPGRTQAFGFLSRMPATTEGAIGMRNLSGIIDGFLNSSVFKRSVDLSEQMGQTFDVQQTKMAQAMIDQYVGKEVFLVMGEGSAEQFQRLQVISQVISDANMRSTGASVAGGSDAGPTAMLEKVRAGLKDKNSDISKALEAFQMVPLLAGSKVTDGAAEVVTTLNNLEANLPPFVTVSKIDAGGGKFTSWKLNLQDVINEGAVAQIDELIQDAATSARVADVLRKKTVEFCFGVVDNYLVFSLGADHKHLDFVTKPEESILAASSFGFADQFLTKKLVGYSFMSNRILKSGTKGGQITQMADSFASGLATGGPAMKKLAGQVKKLAGHMEKLAARGSQTHVGVAYMENGIRGESIGGYTSEMVDFKSLSKFANAAPADAAMVISSVANPKHRGESIAMMETLFSSVQTGFEAYAESSGDGSALEQFNQMEQLFGGNLTSIWGILKGKFIEGLGNQTGIMVDLNGEMPKNLPNVPNVLQEKGRIPRIALMADVADRAKLAEAWEALVPELNAAMKNIPGQPAGAEAQVPDVISDDGDVLSTHYFPIPFMTKDFLPSISLSDELFFMSTSKQFSESLAAGASKDGTIRGAYMEIDFTQFNAAAREWVTLVSENADTIFPNEADAQSFQQSAGQMQMAFEFTSGIKGLKFNRYQEDSGAMRGSWHFHFEDIAPAID